RRRPACCIHAAGRQPPRGGGPRGSEPAGGGATRLTRPTGPGGRSRPRPLAGCAYGVAGDPLPPRSRTRRGVRWNAVSTSCPTAAIAPCPVIVCVGKGGRTMHSFVWLVSVLVLLVLSTFVLWMSTLAQTPGELAGAWRVSRIAVTPGQHVR